MNKAEFVDAIVAKNPELTKTQATNVLNSVTDIIQDAVAAGDKIALVGFGTFEQKTRNARSGVNPATGEKIKIGKKKVPVFKAGKAFKDKVANGRKKRAKKEA